MDTRTIIIHAGNAHADEMYAVAAYSFLMGAECEVYRREPTQKELEDRSVIVLDVGRVHNAMFNNFDHHQLPRGTKECALSLMMQALDLDLHNLLIEFSPWYRGVILQDSLGIMGKAKELDMDAPPPREFGDSVMACILDSMKDLEYFNTEVTPEMGILQSVVDREIRFARSIKGRLEEIATFRNEPMGHDMWVLFLPDDDTTGLREFLARNIGAYEATWAPSPRNPGYKALYRYDERDMDLSSLKNEPEVKFAHNNGFLAIIDENVSIERLKELVDKAVRAAR